MNGPWHAGEREAQRLAGSPEAALARGAHAIRTELGSGQAGFLSEVPVLAIGTADADGRPWASVLVGRPGFVTSPDSRTVRVWTVRAAGMIPTIPEAGHAIGMLALDPLPRHRMRVNGRLFRRDAEGFDVTVEQCFGNCPAHIAPRPVFPPKSGEAGMVEELSALDERALALIARADTGFVASLAPDSGADVSHRGGPPGFVTVDGGGALVVPDYAGNHYFNTLGNLLANPRAGLTLVDFESGEALAVTGTAEILWDGLEVAALPKAKRLWRLNIAKIQWGVM